MYNLDFKKVIEAHEKNISEDIVDANPELFFVVHETSVVLNDLIDNGVFTKDLNPKENELLEKLKETFGNNEELAKEVRTYKSQRLIYAILLTFEELGLISIHKKIIEKTLDPRKEAEKIYTSYEKKHK